MFFCPKCSYSLDIVKSTGSKIINQPITEKKKVTSVTSAIKEIFNNSVNPELLLPSFSLESMKKNAKYKKLAIDKKQELLKLFAQTGGNVNAEFKCSNCSYFKSIDKTTKLYQINVNDTRRKLKDTDYLLIVNNPILARTKDYTCKNSKCPTHKNDANKEAVFYHENEDLTVNYVCTVCQYHYTN